MTTPRCIRPGRTWFVTRRTTRRHFLLRPDADQTVQQIYWYTTAVIAAECGIELHAVQMLSTHMHEVLTDVRGELPRFLQQRNRLLANAIKSHRDWPEEVFARAPTNCVALYGVAAILKEIGYTLANCVEAGLVQHPSEWPGVTVSVNDIGQRVIRVARPDAYFDPDSARWPEVAELRIAMPKPLLEHYLDPMGARSVLRSAVDSAIRLARAAAKAAGRVVQGAARLTRISHHHQARSFEPFGKRVPSFATGGDRAEAKTAKSERLAFLLLYRQAFERLRGGFRDVFFPDGTWRLHQELGFPCVATGTTSQRRSELHSVGSTPSDPYSVGSPSG